MDELFPYLADTEIAGMLVTIRFPATGWDDAEVICAEQGWKLVGEDVDIVEYTEEVLMSLADPVTWH